jgi:hypothetical protein
MKYQVENSKFKVVFETNLSLEEAQDFIEKSEQKELEEFQKNKLNNFQLIKVRIERPILRTESYNQHKSEIDLDDYNDWDFKIENVGTLFDLKESVINLFKSVSQ